MMDIRTKTKLIVKRDGQYLVGWNYVMGCLNWSDYAYDAWRTRYVELARKVARVSRGELMLFNPVAAQMKPYDGMQGGTTHNGRP